MNASHNKASRSYHISELLLLVAIVVGLMGGAGFAYENHLAKQHLINRV